MQKNKVKCHYCGKIFIPCKSSYLRFKKGTRKHLYCSRECSNNAMVTRVPVICSHCGKTFSVVKSIFNRSATKKFFCSHSCFAKHNNKLRGKPRFCKYCGKETRNKVFCSRDCNRKYVNENYIKLWKNGKIPGYQKKSQAISPFVRNYLLEKANFKCSKCGFSGENLKTKKTILQINHIDGNWENCKEDNLEVLCPNCHAMTETFGILNKGNGRTARYKKRKK